MPRPPNQQTYIADGFIHDCDELVYRCIQGDAMNYQVFCNIWKDMGMYNIFVGRPRGAEMGELSEEVLHVAKRYLVGESTVTGSNRIEENIAGLFLVYALMNLQPYKRFAYLRLVAEDIEILRQIEGVARRDRRIDVLYILGSVLIKGPVRYVASPREYGLEMSIRKYTAGYASIEAPSGGKGVFYRKREELDLIKEMNSLSKKYAEAKNVLTKAGQWSRSLNYSNDNLAAELEHSLRKLTAGVNNDDAEVHNGTDEPRHDARAIKDRAMTGVVNPMRHLIAVSDRQSPTKKQAPSKDPTYKPPHAKSPDKSRKRIALHHLKNHRRPRRRSDDEYDETSNINLAAMDAEIESEEQEINIQIENLPAFSRVENDGRPIEVEVIDNFKPKEDVKKELMGPPKKIPKKMAKSVPDSSKDSDVQMQSLPSIEMGDDNNDNQDSSRRERPKGQVITGKARQIEISPETINRGTNKVTKKSKK